MLHSLKVKPIDHVIAMMGVEEAGFVELFDPSGCDSSSLSSAKMPRYRLTTFLNGYAMVDRKGMIVLLMQILSGGREDENMFGMKNTYPCALLNEGARV